MLIEYSLSFLDTGKYYPFSMLLLCIQCLSLMGPGTSKKEDHVTQEVETRGIKYTLRDKLEGKKYAGLCIFCSKALLSESFVM